MATFPLKVGLIGTVAASLPPVLLAGAGSGCHWIRGHVPALTFRCLSVNGSQVSANGQQLRSRLEAAALPTRYQFRGHNCAVLHRMAWGDGIHAPADTSGTLFYPFSRVISCGFNFSMVSKSQSQSFSAGSILSSFCAVTCTCRPMARMVVSRF